MMRRVTPSYTLLDPKAGATIYVRTNQTLKRQAELAAKEAGLSLNAYVIRCLEAGVAPDEKSRMAAGWRPRCALPSATAAPRPTGRLANASVT